MGLVFPQLRRLSLSIWDSEMLNMSIELLDCIESPTLQKIFIEGCMLNHYLFQGVCRATLGTSGGMVGLKVMWYPTRHQVLIDEAFAQSLNALLPTIPKVEELILGI